jgi:uncharacterized protein (DUF3084 family)
MASATKEQLDILKAANDEREQQLKKADAQLETSEEQIKRLKEQVGIMENQNHALENEVGKLNQLAETFALESHERLVQLATSGAQLARSEAQLDKAKSQLAEQEEQIKKLWEIHGNLRLALQGLAVAGDTFDHFGGILAQHAETLSERIDHITETSANLDQTATVLAHLTQSLENHIESNRHLSQTRALLYGGMP